MADLKAVYRAVTKNAAETAGRQVGQAVPGGYPFLAQEVGQPICLLQVSGRCP